MGWWPCCCCSEECTVFTETFDGPSLPDTLTVGGDLNTLDGNARTDDFLSLIYTGTPVCQVSASVSVGLSDSSALGVGDQVRIALIDTNPSVDLEDGVIAEIEYTSSAPYEWTVRLYKSTDARNDLEDGLGTLLAEDTYASLPSTLKLCYDDSAGIARVFVNGTNALWSNVTGVTIDGNMRFGLCLDTYSGGMSFTDVSFERVSDLCDDCVSDCSCSLCSDPDQTPCVITASFADLPDIADCSDPDAYWAIANGNVAFNVGTMSFVDPNDDCDAIISTTTCAGAAAVVMSFRLMDNGDGTYDVVVGLRCAHASDSDGDNLLVFRKTYNEKPACHEWSATDIPYSAGESSPPAGYSGTPTCEITAS